MEKKNENYLEKILFFLAAILLCVILLHCVNAWDSFKGTELENNLIEAISYGMNHFQSNPFALRYSETVQIVLAYYATIIFVVYIMLFVNRKVTLFGREFGSARWATRREEKKFADKDEKNNIILSQDIRMSLNPKVTGRNLNILVNGGTGAGKTWYLVTPNMMQLNCNYVVTDPKGSTFKSLARMLENDGYEVLLLNLIEKEYSGCYNFFEYIHKESDILKVSMLLIKSTNPPEQQASGGDPFWDNSAIIWLEATIGLVWMEYPKEQQNMETIMHLLALSTASEEDENQKSPVDEIFEALEKKKGKNYFPCKQYSLYKKAAGKTAKSILITIGARLSAFNLKEIRDMTRTDTLHLDQLGYGKKALFLVIPDTDTSLNFLVTMIYTQLFDELFFQADFGEMKWSDGQAYYHSRKSLIDKRNKLESLLKAYLAASNDAASGRRKIEKLRNGIYSVMDEIEKEFGVPPLKERILKEQTVDTYMESLDTLSRRMNQRTGQLKRYYHMLLHADKILHKINQEAKKLTNKNLIHARQAQKEKYEKIRTVIKRRLLYEYGIAMPYKGKDAEIKFLHDIRMVYEELERSHEEYGSKNTLFERRERMEALLKQKAALTKSVKEDYYFWEIKKRKNQKEQIKKIKEKIRILETITFYEFGIKDMSKRLNGGKLPRHVRCILDEFANISPIPDFQKILAVMRSRNVSATIILQNLAQLKEKFKDAWENITGNCDTFVFLGGQEQQTLKYVSEKLGKLTLDKRTNGLSRGNMSNSSENWDRLGRELKTSDEIGRMPNEDCIIFVRGMYPYYSKKYKTQKHKMYKEVCQDLENESAPNFYPYKKIFVTEEAAQKMLIDHDKEENRRLLKAGIDKTIKSKIFSERTSYAKSIAQTEAVDTILTAGRTKSMEKQVIDTYIRKSKTNIPYAVQMSASQIMTEDTAKIKDLLPVSINKPTEEVVHDELLSEMIVVERNDAEEDTTTDSLKDMMDTMVEYQLQGVDVKKVDRNNDMITETFFEDFSEE